MATNYPTFQRDPILNSVSASLGTFNTVTASVISASSYLGTSDVESAIYVGNKTISGSLTVSSSINTLQSITSSGDISVNGLRIGRGSGNGNLNVAIGSNVLNNNISANFITAVGAYSLFSNRTGTNNVGVGYEALYFNVSGSNNIAVGNSTFRYMTRGDNNIAIGHNAGSSISLINTQNSVIIGGNNGSTANNTTGSIIISDGGGNIRIQADNTGLVTIPGTLAVSGGIRFPATMSANTNPNTLDDYEEGTWTPTMYGSEQFTSSYTNATYVKIGKKVFVELAYWISSTGSATGSVYIGNLPFSVNNNSTGIISPNSWYAANASLNVLFVGSCLANTTTVQLMRAAAGGITNIIVTNMANGAQFNFNGCYETS